MNNFTGNKWWEQKNPSYRESCKKQAIRELIISKGQYDYFIKRTSKVKTN